MKKNLGWILLNLLLLAICMTYITTTLHITVIQAILIWLSIGFATGSAENIFKIIYTHFKNSGQNSNK